MIKEFIVTPDSEPTDDSKPAKELAQIQAEVIAIHQTLRSNSLSVLWQSFLRGVAFGLGSFLGATLVVSFLIYSLSSIDFIPIIGEWAAQIAERITEE